MGRRSSKEQLLDAAERVIKRQGMASTTIEAVAAEAGLSKGGLFYHFSSKKDMLMQLIERYERQFKALRQKIHDSLPEGPHRMLKATILASTKHAERASANISNIITLLDDVELREVVRKMKIRLFTEITQGYPHPQKVALALLAADGLWVMDLFAGEVIPEGLENQIVEELLALIDIHVEPKVEGTPCAHDEVVMR
ncbi:MAG: TetR/AcrR family transcriptional regulator [Planctomycetaceae bacterium]|nr:TetR/AcrR family transcriptional regulator [Planctomycetaceae bacterium]